MYYSIIKGFDKFRGPVKINLVSQHYVKFDKNRDIVIFIIVQGVFNLSLFFTCSNKFVTMLSIYNNRIVY